MLVLLERKIAKHDPQMRMMLFQKIIEETGDVAAGRTLEVTKLFQRNWRVRLAPNVHRSGIAFSGNNFVLRNGEKNGSLRAIKNRAAPKRGQSDHGHNHKRQITFHKSARAGKFQRKSRFVKYDLALPR